MARSSSEQQSAAWETNAVFYLRVTYYTVVIFATALVINAIANV